MPDAELIARIKSGEVKAFGELYRRHLVAIYRYIRTRVRTDQDAEDLTETTFLKAFEALGRYRERGVPFAAFLYRIAANSVVDHYRSQKPMEQIEEIEGIAADEPAAEMQVIHGESLRQVQQALSRLPDRDQEVIRLRVLLEFPTKQVAEWTGRSPEAIRVHLHRALKALRHELGVIDEQS